ncbi:MAG TPA: carboxypeptidase-like regulatory domain-containing protein, partial [Bacillota bacterium]|nr:carboxypeptidase-like regulatory domain-containing protein [Bacillota bacterium]
MQTFKYLAVSIMIILLILIAGCGDPPTYLVTVTIRGVDGVSGELIPTATAVTSSGKSGSVSNGVTVFSGMEGDRDYEFICTAPNYQESRLKAHIAHENISLNIKMGSFTGSISGVVVDEQEHPLQASIKLVELERNVETNPADGAFQFSDVPIRNEPYSVQIMKTGYETRIYGNILISASDLNKNLGKLILSNTPGSLCGRVLNQDDRVVDNCTVKVVEVGETATTDGNGDFSISILPGTYTVEFSHPEYQTYQKTEVRVSGNNSTYLTARLIARPGSISGFVVDNYNAGVDGVQVAIIGRQDSTKTLSNGYFSFTNIPP